MASTLTSLSTAPVKAVLFDSGGVLMQPIGGRWNPRADFEPTVLRRHPQITAERFTEAIALGESFMAEAGSTPDLDDYHTVMLEHLGVDPTTDLLAELVRPVPATAVTFLYGVSGNITSAGQVALLKNLVPPQQLADANGLEQTLYQAARLITPALGVELLARFGAPTVLGLDIATFLIAGLLLAAVPVRETQAPPPTGPHPAARPRRPAEIAAGIRFLAANPLLRTTSLAQAVDYLGFGLLVPLGLQVITDGLHDAPSFIGVTITVQSVFGVAGAAVAGRIARKLGDSALMLLGTGLFAGACALLALPSTPVALSAIALLGLAIPWFLIGAATIVQKATPLELIGRVSGVNTLVAMVPQALGNLLGAALVLALPFRLTAILLAALLALTALPITLAAARSTPGRGAPDPVPAAATAPGTDPDPAPPVSAGSPASPAAG